MGSVRAEFLKVRRSASWVVAVLLPVAVVVAGAVNTLVAGQQPEDGWHTVWVRSVVFHGLFPLPVGIAVLASLVWRVEHKGGNWNALMSGPTSTLRLLVGKAVVIVALTAVAQVVLLLTVVTIGAGVFGLSGGLPIEYLAVGVVIVIAGVPVAVLQSGASMLLRSFAAPVAVAFLGAGASMVLLLAKLDVASVVVPYSLLGRATRLGTGTFTDSGAISGGDIAMLVLGALAQSAVLLAATTALLDRRDVHT